MTHALDLVQLARSGYAEISVSGQLSAPVSSKHVESEGHIPPELQELRDLIDAQSQSRATQLIGEILYEEYEILQIIPATSEPVPHLMVHVLLTPLSPKRNRHLHLTLELNHQLESWRAEVEGVLVEHSSLDEIEQEFCHVTRGCLKTAFHELKAPVREFPF